MPRGWGKHIKVDLMMIFRIKEFAFIFLDQVKISCLVIDALIFDKLKIEQVFRRIFFFISRKSKGNICVLINAGDNSWARDKQRKDKC